MLQASSYANQVHAQCPYMTLSALGRKRIWKPKYTVTIMIITTRENFDVSLQAFKLLQLLQYMIVLHCFITLLSPLSGDPETSGTIPSVITIGKQIYIAVAGQP